MSLIQVSNLTFAYEGSYENIVGLPGDDVMMYLKTM